MKMKPEFVATAADATALAWVTDAAAGTWLRCSSSSGTENK